MPPVLNYTDCRVAVAAQATITAAIGCRVSSKAAPRAAAGTAKIATAMGYRSMWNLKTTPGRGKNTRRKRAPRRVLPEHRNYILENAPTPLDVVSGRGGRSNNHPGNRPYWIKILQERRTYRQLVGDEMKRQVARSIVAFVQKRGGRFLQLDREAGRWFLLPPKHILEKVMQALRDSHVPLWAREEMLVDEVNNEECLATSKGGKAKAEDQACSSVPSDAPRWRFSLVVCHDPETRRWLAVEENDNKGWWLPGGLVESDDYGHEGAAARLTKEQAGINIVLKGVLQTENEVTIYYAEPKNNCQPPKSTPDRESQRAEWLSVSDLEKKRLRGLELLVWARYLEAGGKMLPLGIVQRTRIQSCE